MLDITLYEPQPWHIHARWWIGDDRRPVSSRLEQQSNGRAWRGTKKRDQSCSYTVTSHTAWGFGTNFHCCVVLVPKAVDANPANAPAHSWLHVTPTWAGRVALGTRGIRYWYRHPHVSRSTWRLGDLAALARGRGLGAPLLHQVSIRGGGHF